MRKYELFCDDGYDWLLVTPDGFIQVRGDYRGEIPFSILKYIEKDHE